MENVRDDQISCFGLANQEEIADIFSLFLASALVVLLLINGNVLLEVTGGGVAGARGHLNAHGEPMCDGAAAETL